MYGVIAAGCRQAAPAGIEPAFLFGIIGAGLSVASALMKRMLSLRTVALAANASFLTYGLLEANLVMMLLHGSMLPVNAWRVMNIRKLVRDIESARSDAPIAEWLLPHMKQRQAKAGQTLWRRGDTATEMLYVKKGTVRLVEYDEILGPGSMVGEIGLFAPDCTLYSLSASGMYQLYYQNPKLGFHIMRLVVARMTHNMTHARPAFVTEVPPQPIAVKPIEVTSIEVKRIEVKPVQEQPMEAEPMEDQPVHVKPIEVKPVEVKPIAVRPPDRSAYPVPYKLHASWF